MLSSLSLFPNKYITIFVITLRHHVFLPFSFAICSASFYAGCHSPLPICSSLFLWYHVFFETSLLQPFRRHFLMSIFCCYFLLPSLFYPFFVSISLSLLLRCQAFPATVFPIPLSPFHFRHFFLAISHNAISCHNISAWTSSTPILFYIVGDHFFGTVLFPPFLCPALCCSFIVIMLSSQLFSLPFISFHCSFPFPRRDLFIAIFSMLSSVAFL